MARWSPKLKYFIDEVRERKEDEGVLESFFENRAFIPESEQDRRDYEEFSLITSSMALLIHVAKANKVVSKEEKERIISDLMFQLEQRRFEYEKLSDSFGKDDREIVENLFELLLKEYEDEQLDLDESIRLINKIYRENLEKRYYILRLCLYCAYSDKDFDEDEEKAVKDLAEKLHVPKEELKRIEEEVRKELKLDK